MWTDDLQANGKALGSEAARNGNRGQTPDIKRPRIAQHEMFAGTEGIGIIFEFGNSGRGNRRGWSDEKVYVFEH